jgi:aminoglycoside phosphotransferase (APT) family kinase protein
VSQVDPDRALRGGAGLAGVRALLNGAGRASLLRSVQAMARPGCEVHSLRLHRVHFKPGKKLAAYYEVMIGGAATTVPLAVTWFVEAPDGDARLAGVAQAVGESRAAGPFMRHWRVERSGALLLTIAPLDPVFPHLLTLADASHAAARLFPEHAVMTGTARVQFVRYRPGQRHVLRYTDGTGRDRFAKLYRPGECAPVLDASCAFAAHSDATGVDAVRTVRPSAGLADCDALLYEHVSGVALSQHLKYGALPAQQIVDTGRWMRALHDRSPAAQAAFRRRSADEEARRVMRACAAMSVLRPDLVERARSAVDLVAARLADREGEEPAVVVHGDMKADHLLCTSRSVAVLDTDSCAIADPALDLGKLLADLRWWSLLSARPHQARAEAALLAGYAPAPARLARAYLFAAMLLVKMAGRRVSLARPDWARRTADVLDLAEQLLRRPAAVAVVP